MAHFEKQLSSETIFTGRVFTVTVDKVEQETGRISTREVVHHNGGLCVCAVDDEDNVYFVRQFRYAFGQELLELPAGKREGTEDPMEGAIRELQEEVGCQAAHVEDLGKIYPSTGYLTEVLHCYYATGLTFTKQHLDEGEFLDVVKMPFSEALEKVISGEIRDGKSQIMILKVDALRRRRAAQQG